MSCIGRFYHRYGISILVVMAGIAITFIPAGSLFGFVPLNLPYFLLTGVLVGYIVVVERVKTRFYRVAADSGSTQVSAK